MKIGIDASRAFSKERTGTEEYAYQLIKNLTKIECVFCQFFLFVRDDSEIDIDLPENFSIIRIKGKKLWTQARLSWRLWKSPVDVLFIPSHAIPFIHPKKTVVTIHGLESKTHPECYSFKDRIVLEINTLISILFSQKIIVPSENTKKDLIRCYNVRPERIEVVNHGIEHKTWNMEHESRRNNILFIGRIEKRKNILNLVKAFEIFKESYKLLAYRADRQATSYKLILAGKAGFGFNEIKKEIKKSPYKNDIILTGYVAESKKEELYAEADIFIFPSFCEGFGMPILEAQCRNVPVVCSDIPPFNEIGKDSVLYFNPANPQDIAGKIKNIFEDEELRASLIKKGEENVIKFDWNISADETLKIIRSI